MRTDISNPGVAKAWPEAGVPYCEQSAWVAVTAVFLVGMAMPFTAHGWAITNAALLAIVVTELARYGTIIAAYRRGWHG